jgi:hypothetical protein
MQAVAFTHLVYDDDSVFSDKTSLRDWIDQNWGPSLKRFAACRNIKLVYLFLANAYRAHLVALNKPETRLLAKLATRRETKLRRAIRRHLQSVPHKKKFVIVGIKELVPLLAPMEDLSKNSADKGAANVNLNRLFLGEGQKVLYDCPKVVEALIRIARRNGDPDSPILRFDEDVAVSAASVDELIAEFQSQRQLHPYFFFSGTYNFHSLDQEQALHWLNDFSVRVHFLSHHEGADLDSYLAEKGFPLDGSVFATRSKEISEAFKGREDEKLTLDLDLAKSFLKIAGLFGADLDNQPISGAGLCISPMAIVQLPPFANVAQQIMWIDDDLKHRLHLGIGDLDPDQNCFVESAVFEQNRHPQGIQLKDLFWGYSAYLPRVVIGCLLNALMYDPNKETHGAFASSFSSYMSSRSKPSKEHRAAWAEEAKERLADLRKEIVDHPAANKPIWKPLADFARYELTYDPAQHDCIVDSVVQDPDKDIAQLCTGQGLPIGRNAGAYVAEVISDLHRYIELVDLWPYIVRTLDFLVRNEPPNHWLKDPPLL